MSVKRNLIISLLKLTKEQEAFIETISTDARIPNATSMFFLEKLQNEGLIFLDSDRVHVECDGRLKLAVKAAGLGADVETISHLLGWHEFEEIAALALKTNGFTVHNNVRFKHADHRWEIDAVGCKKPLVICIDCKHWQHAITQSALRKIVDLQAQRTQALADSLPTPKLKLDCTKWEKAQFIPAVLSLIPSPTKFINQTPIVPVLQFQDFIHQLPAYVGTLKFFTKPFKALSHDL